MSGPPEELTELPGEERSRTTVTVRFILNGTRCELEAAANTSLLDWLRERAGLTGTKKGCDQGACGACTVLIDGQRVLSCLTLVAQLHGASITTIEGLEAEGRVHPLQQGFIEEDGFQCGYCTPGQICSALGMLEEVDRGAPSYVTDDLSDPTVSLDRVELCERMSGNLCRCGAHNGIVAAIETFYRERPQ